MLVTTPFARLKQQPVGKVSVNLPTHDWLCKNLDKLNLTLVKATLQGVQRVVGCREISMSRLPNLRESRTVYTPVRTWTNATNCHSGTSLQNRTVAIAGLPDPPDCYLCTQATGFSRCQNKVQQNMETQLRVIQTKQGNGKSAIKMSTATDEL